MENEYRIQQLLEAKSFEQLTKTEQVLVLASITQDEYIARYNALANIKSFLAEDTATLSPTPFAQTAAVAMLRAKKEQKGTSGFYTLLYIRIPAYAVAAALLLLLGISWYFERIASDNHLALTKHPAPIMVYKTDTVIVEKIMPQQWLAPQKVTVAISKKSAKSLIDNHSHHSLAATTNAFQRINPITFSKEQVDEQLKNVGATNNSQQALNKFLVSAK